MPHTQGIQGIGIELSHLSLQYKDALQPIIGKLDMSLHKGKWTALLGKSGCGKTTVLRYLAGLLSDKVRSTGEVHIVGGDPSTGTQLNGNIAYMAQQDLLMPWLNVIENVCFANKFSANAQSPSDTARAHQLLARVGLQGHALNMPAQLSGGMRQRVALARTLMQDKAIILMDEPFSALDAVTRHHLQALAVEMLADKTVLLITHDPLEALRLSESIYIMQGQPASAVSIAVPNTVIPRTFDAQLAQLQQQIITTLEVDHV